MIKMNTILLFSLLFTTSVFSQEETTPEESSESIESIEVVEENIETPPDTTRITIGNTEIIVVEHEENPDNEFEEYFEEDETTENNLSITVHRPSHNGTWAGLELGVTTLMNDQYGSNFPNTPYWDNDEAKSEVWNLNLFDYKFNLGSKGHFGITTGAGFSWTSISFKDNYVLTSSPDTVVAYIDTTTSYSKNKLNASYFRMPLLLEFKKPNSFYFSTGVIAAVRMYSKTKRKGEFDGKNFKQKVKGVYGLESFKLDATARMGYGSWGVFASYSLFPIFDTSRTVEVYPLTFGLSLNF